MLSHICCYLTTERGGWAVIAVTLAHLPLALWSFDVSTFSLSVIAILVGVAILARQGSKDELDGERDKAAHGKLDDLQYVGRGTIPRSATSPPASAVAWPSSPAGGTPDMFGALLALATIVVMWAVVLWVLAFGGR